MPPHGDAPQQWSVPLPEGDTPQRQAARRVVEILRQAGHTALWAGGCVRDLLLGRSPKDYDVATDATPQRVRGLFAQTVEVGLAFGVVRVRLKLSGQWTDVEVATFRRDLGYDDGRHPTAVEFCDPRSDAQRRDFTINGMFYDPVTGQVIDYVAGREDLAARQIRAIGRAEDRFGEDRLRMLRAVRFATILGFEITPDTWSAMRAAADRIAVVSGERIRDELLRVLGHANRREGVQQLWQSGLLGAVIPECPRAYGIDPRDAAEAPVPQGLLAALGALPCDAAWTTTLATLIAGLPSSPIPSMQRTSIDALRVFVDAQANAAAQQARQTEAVCQRLACSRAERHLVTTLTTQQWSVCQAALADLAAAKRLLARPEWPALWHRHIALAAAFDLGPTLHAAVARLADLAAGLTPDEIRPPPLLTGHDLIAAGVSPGPRVGGILGDLYDRQLRGELSTRAEAIALARRLALPSESEQVAGL